MYYLSEILVFMVCDLHQTLNCEFNFVVRVCRPRVATVGSKQNFFIFFSIQNASSYVLFCMPNSTPVTTGWKGENRWTQWEGCLYGLTVTILCSSTLCRHYFFTQCNGINTAMSLESSTGTVSQKSALRLSWFLKVFRRLLVQLLKIGRLSDPNEQAPLHLCT